MDPTRWGRIKEVFEGALERDPAERHLFLADTCAEDDDLRAQVMHLLVQHEAAGNFLEAPFLALGTVAITADRDRAVFLPGQIVAQRFRIVQLLGQGGMGEVYEAFDSELQAAIALKTVRHDLAADARFIERFKREVQRSRAVTHPNVCRVYDLFREPTINHGDVWFLTMELLRGETLSDRLSREGRLDIVAALPLVKQMCDALDAAHHAGVVHRDFKSRNVMLIAGADKLDVRVAVTDFGLARPIGRTETNTQSLDDLEGVLGTLAYMAPEQLEGKPATAASDLYALGVVIYETVTGTRPFTADSALSAAVQRVTEPPPSPRTHVPDLDRRWERTIMRCLERDASARFAHAEQVSRALAGDGTSGIDRRAVAIGAAIALTSLLLFNVFNRPALAVNSIAVVPFLNDGHDRDAEYLSDGVTEGIIDSLAQGSQSGLKVIAFNSVARYRGAAIDAKAIGRQLHVGAVVVGKVVHRADTLSITAELVNAADDSHVWGKTYSTGLSDLPGVQDEIAGRITEALRFRGDDRKQRLTKRYAVSGDAYRLYLKGRYFWNKYTEEGWKKAIESFNQAIEIDPNYALAWAGVADSYYQLSSLVLTPAEAIPRARAAATRALAIDDGVAEAHASLGMIKAQYDWDGPGAEKELRRAIELNPNYATAHQWYGMYLFSNAQFQAARVELNKAQELDPLSLFIAVTAVWPLRHLGQDDLAVTQIGKIIEMFPNVADLVEFSHEVRGEIYLQKHMHDEAVAEMLNGYRTRMLCGNEPETIEALKRAYAAAGLDGYWRTQLDLATRRYRQELETSKHSTHRYISPYRLAELHARLGNTEPAFALLQESARNRDESLRWLKAESLSVNSPWESLRSDPRFTALLHAVGLDG